MIAHYHTIKKPGEGIFKDRGSKFISYAFGVKTTEDVDEQLRGLRKVHHDARHHCYAWMLGMNQESFRANDDGEPGHSAGDPILGQIKSRGLTNCLIVVVRYFGGTKLGVSGLINAYKTAADLALEVAGMQRIDIYQHIEIVYPYASTNDVLRLMDTFQVIIVDQHFDAECQVKAKIGIANWNQFVAKFTEMQQTGTKAALRLIE